VLAVAALGSCSRHVVVHAPTLVTLGTGQIELLRFAFHEEFGFAVDELKHLLLKCPVLWTSDRERLQKTFDYCHNVIGLSHERLLAWPRVLRYPVQHVRVRHEFLRLLGRDQFDPERPNYVSMKAMCEGADAIFCTRVAKTSALDYDRFLKTR